MMSIKIAIPICLLLILQLGCHRSPSSAATATKFKIIDVRVRESGVINIQDCAKWYIDFSRIKTAVVYHDKIICMGLNGGFACLNYSNLIPDSILEIKMNTDFFTNVSVYADTLFAEKFGKLYFWDFDRWIRYDYEKPIQYFSLLYEDDIYTFYSSCAGEFGAILFVYNKKTNITRAKFTTCLNSVIKTDSGYFIGTHSYHMAGHSETYTIHDIERLKPIPDSLRFLGGMFDREPALAFLMDTSLEERLESKISLYADHPFYQTEMIIASSFKMNERLYHIIDPKNYREEGEKRFIGTVEKDSLMIIDSLRDCAAESTLAFGNTTIIHEAIWGRGCTLIRNDTIFKIRFSTTHTGYSGPKLDGYNFITDTSARLTSYKESIFHFPPEDEYELKPGIPEHEIKFRLGKKYRILGYYGNGMDGNFIYNNTVRTKLKFKDEWNFLKKIFVYDGRLFVFFGNLGNYGFKYGLVEITDIDKFAATYKE